MSFEIVLAVLLTFAPFAQDRGDSPEARRALLASVASAIVATARTRNEAAWLVTQAHFESQLARNVLENHCERMPAGMRCDSGRARGPWQVWRWCAAGAVSFEAEAGCALGLARQGELRCRSWDGAFIAQAGIRGCIWPGAVRRVREMHDVLVLFRQLEKARAKEPSVLTAASLSPSEADATVSAVWPER